MVLVSETAHTLHDHITKSSFELRGLCLYPFSVSHLLILQHKRIDLSLLVFVELFLNVIVQIDLKIV